MSGADLRYATGAEIEVGDYVVYTRGHPDAWDWGQVAELHADHALVSWFGSQQRALVSYGLLAKCTPFSETGTAWARREYELAHIAEDTGRGPRTVGPGHPVKSP